MKKLTSFRLPESAKQDLKHLAAKHKLSEAGIIEVMLGFVDIPSQEFNFSVAVRSYKLTKSKNFQKLEEEYAKLNADEQKAMRQKLLENFTVDDFDE